MYRNPGSRIFAQACGVLGAIGLLMTASNARAQDDLYGRDKTLHFAVSAALSMGSYSVAIALDAPPETRVLWAIGLPLAAGSAKELFDALGHGDASTSDLAWDAVGTFAGLSIALLLDLWLSPDAPSSARRETETAPEAGAAHAVGMPPLLFLHEVTPER